MCACHRCETENAAEYSCPDCGQYTCESCFEPMTQFNAGTPCVCLTCAGIHEEERHREAEREHKREVEAERARAAKASEARRVYNSPEAVAQRAAEKANRDAMRAKVRAEEKAILVDLFSHFFG